MPTRGRPRSPTAPIASIVAASALGTTDQVAPIPAAIPQLEKLSLGFTDRLEFHESYSWAVTAKYLDIAGGILREARNRGPEVIRGTVKATYAGAIGKMHALSHRDDYHLHRPDWTDVIQGAARTAVVAILDDIRTTSGATPLVVDRDTIVYASNTPDPWDAWPGPAAKLGALAGGWRPIGSARLDQWGPVALPPREGRSSWSYARHTATLTPPPAQPGIQAGIQAGEQRGRGVR